MPCYITGTEIGDAQLGRDEAIKEAQEVTRLLCKACEYMDEKNIAIPYQVSIWWRKHEKRDKEVKK